jgi:3-deoxy-7-phosphoheptulonate synthase
MTKLVNARVLSQEQLPAPEAFHLELSQTPQTRETVMHGRDQLEAILEGRDKRLFVVVGPCSIHDTEAALVYAAQLKTLADEVADVLLLVMRVYFEKPRTTVGWKGLINDPYRDDSFRIVDGIRMARKLLLDVARVGLPTATEALDPLMPQYLGDLISWNAIGARTTESQTHREMASGLSTPVGLKNGTDGSLSVAINAIQSAGAPHAFLGMNEQGQTCVVKTAGNPHGHLILRGGSTPNYDKASIENAELLLSKAGLRPAIVVDCSHGNSNKDYARQVIVLDNVIDQVVAGNTSVVGVMIESNLVEGAQKPDPDATKMRYGQSVTDSCIGWETTLVAIRNAAAALRGRDATSPAMS